MNDDELGRAIASIAGWYEPGEAPDPTELDRRADGGEETAAPSRVRLVVLTAATVAVLVGGLVAMWAVWSDDPSSRLTSPASPDETADSSPAPIETGAPATTGRDVESGTTTDPSGEDDRNNEADHALPPVSLASAWRSVSQSPLSPRNAAIGVWTGREVLVFGGTSVPLCPVCDYATAPEPLLDGAAYEPSSDTWRTIADPPADVALSASAVVVGDDVFVGSSSEGLRFWSYSIPADQWSRIEVPNDVPAAFPVVAPRNRLVFAHGEVAGVDQRDFVYDPATGDWSPLPEAPFGVGWFDRSYLAVDDRLVLFAKRPPAEVEPDEPNVIAAALLDETTDRWRLLPDSQQLDAPYFSDGPTAVNPDRGGADGGSVNGWERVVPNGGELRLDDETWHPFPIHQAQVAWQGGAIGTTSAMYLGVQGDVYDTVTGEWLSMPTLPNGLGNDNQTTTVAAGLDVFVFGGFDGQTDGMPVTNAAFLLDAHRTE